MPLRTRRTFHYGVHSAGRIRRAPAVALRPRVPRGTSDGSHTRVTSRAAIQFSRYKSSKLQSTAACARCLTSAVCLKEREAKFQREAGHLTILRSSICAGRAAERPPLPNRYIPGLQNRDESDVDAESMRQSMRLHLDLPSWSSAPIPLCTNRFRCRMHENLSIRSTFRLDDHRRAGAWQGRTRLHRRSDADAFRSLYRAATRHHRHRMRGWSRLADLLRSEHPQTGPPTVALNHWLRVGGQQRERGRPHHGGYGASRATLRFFFPPTPPGTALTTASVVPVGLRKP